MREPAKTAGRGGIIAGGVGLAADITEGSGLDKAAAAAGGVFRGIFGLLPWNSPESVSDVVSQTPEATGQAIALVGSVGVV